jgi:hypothetical protein
MFAHAAMCIGIYHIVLALAPQASKFSSFAQPQSKCLLLLFSKSALELATSKLSSDVKIVAVIKRPSLTGALEVQEHSFRLITGLRRSRSTYVSCT